MAAGIRKEKVELRDKNDCSAVGRKYPLVDTLCCSRIVETWHREKTNKQTKTSNLATRSIAQKACPAVKECSFEHASSPRTNTLGKLFAASPSPSHTTSFGICLVLSQALFRNKRLGNYARPGQPRQTTFCGKCHAPAHSLSSNRVKVMSQTSRQTPSPPQCSLFLIFRSATTLKQKGSLVFTFWVSFPVS